MMVEVIPVQSGEYTGPGLRASASGLIDDPNDPAASYYRLTAENPDKKLGFRFVKSEIVHVVPGGWAEKNGIEVDDEIMTLNERKFNDFTTAKAKSYIVDTRPLTIKFKRPKFKDSYLNVEYGGLYLSGNHGITLINNTVVDLANEGWGATVLQVGDQVIEIKEKTVLDQKGRPNMTAHDIMTVLSTASQENKILMTIKRPSPQHVDRNAIAEYALAHAQKAVRKSVEKIMPYVEKGGGYGGYDVSSRGGINEHVLGTIEIEDNRQTPSQSGAFMCGGIFGNCCAVSQ